MVSVRVKDHMVSQPVTILQSATIAEAARAITEHKVSGVVWSMMRGLSWGCYQS